jgi:hypothetical protein
MRGTFGLRGRCSVCGKEGALAGSPGSPAGLYTRKHNGPDGQECRGSNGPPSADEVVSGGRPS